MGILDDLRHKVEKLGDRAKEGLDDARDKAGDLFDDAKDKAGDLFDDAKERFSDDDERSPLSESSDVGPDSASTDAVQPGYVTGEDDVTGSESDESSLTDDAADDAGELDTGADEAITEDSFGDDAATTASAAPAAELDAEELVEQDGAATTETDAPDPVEADPVEADPVEADPIEADQSEADQSEAAVETDVDPFDEPLTETIGDELAAAGFDPDTVAGTVVDADRDSKP